MANNGIAAHSPEWERAIEALAATHGAPLRVTLEVPAGLSNAFTGTRQAEIVMVVRRGDQYVVMTKPFYPEGMWRLPTGGVKKREQTDILAAHARELLEETGLTEERPRFLAAITYVLDGARRYWTFAFLTEWDGRELVTSDPDEVMTFDLVTLAGLEELADRMAALESSWSEDLDEDWAAWGWQRAGMQRAVVDALRRLG